MAKIDNSGAKNVKRIKVQKNGPYQVEGDIPLVRKTQVVSEYGEPLTWKKDGEIETSETYTLCSCGQSGHKPFCDNTHYQVDFRGMEQTDTSQTAERQIIYPGGTKIAVKYDYSLCMDSGFCCTRNTCIEDMVLDTEDTDVRSHVMAMVERCPSGSLTYSLKEGEEDIEPDLPQQIAATTEITSDGPIEGPLWVTGNIPIDGSDGKTLEIRNRVTLCSCGLSKNKPLCDGTHRRLGIKEKRWKK